LETVVFAYEIIDISPNYATQGQSLWLAITAEGTNFENCVLEETLLHEVNMPYSIYAEDMIINSLTSIDLYFNIPDDAFTMAYSLTISCDGTHYGYNGYQIYEEGVVLGCDESIACNYDETANTYDGSCEYASNCHDCDGGCTCNVDCAGDCGGDLEFDCGGVCGGDNSTALNCCGLPFNDDCTSDCYEDQNSGECCPQWDVDECGVCNGGGDGTDCNNDGIPDDCEEVYTAGLEEGILLGGQSGDANGDGTLDVLDIVYFIDVILNP